jgi:hypothetical protein
MNIQLYRLVYCSRNRIRGSAAHVAAELHTILESARVNNARLGVTGALIFNAGNFAQVLEGPPSEVGKIFEKIQRDLRHSEVTVVQSGPAVERQFPDWSMAFAGDSSPDLPETARAFAAGFGHAVGAGDQMLAILRTLVVQEDEWILIDA